MVSVTTLLWKSLAVFLNFSITAKYVVEFLISQSSIRSPVASLASLVINKSSSLVAVLRCCRNLSVPSEKSCSKIFESRDSHHSLITAVSVIFFLRFLSFSGRKIFCVSDIRCCLSSPSKPSYISFATTISSAASIVNSG